MQTDLKEMMKFIISSVVFEGNVEVLSWPCHCQWHHRRWQRAKTLAFSNTSITSHLTWKQLTERDRREWKLSAINPHDRDTWRSGVRSPMRAASQLPGRGPTVVDMAPIPAR